MNVYTLIHYHYLCDPWPNCSYNKAIDFLLMRKYLGISESGGYETTTTGAAKLEELVSQL